MCCISNDNTSSPLTRSLYGKNYDSVALNGTAHTLRLRDQIDTQRLLLVSQPEECASEVLVFLANNYFVTRAWPKNEASVVFKTLLQSSQVLQADVEHLAEIESKNALLSTQDLLLISRRLWRQANTWKTPGTPEITAEGYDEDLDILAAKQRLPSVLQSCIINKLPDICSLIAAGAKLHLLSRSANPSIYRDPEDRNIAGFENHWDTPTSLAMCTSDDFYYWRDALARAGINIPEFIDEELRQSPGNGGLRPNPLASRWTLESLSQLFHQDFTPSACKRSCACSWWHMTIPQPTLKQPKWLQFLRVVKSPGMKAQWPILELPNTHQTQVGEFVKQALVNLTNSETPSPFCFPDHKGCYLCENCWYDNGYVQDFWSTRDIDPDYKVLRPGERLDLFDEEDSPFLLSFE